MSMNVTELVSSKQKTKINLLYQQPTIILQTKVNKIIIFTCSYCYNVDC